MRQFAHIIIIFSAIFALASCDNENNAEKAIEKTKEAIENSYRESVNQLIDTSNARAAFFKSIYELNDEDFKTIYPKIEEWQNEAKELCDVEVARYYEEEDALSETLERLYESISKRMDIIEADI